MANALDAIGDTFAAGANFVGSKVDDGKKLFDAAIAAARTMSPSEVGHLVLDGVGMVPVVGEVADLANGVWYAAEGNKLDAALSLGSAIPLAGNIVTGAKWGKYALNAADTATDVMRLAGKTDEVLQGVETINDFSRATGKADEVIDSARLGDTAGDLRTAGRTVDTPDSPKGKLDDAARRADGLQLTNIKRTQGANSMEWNVDDQGRFVSGRATLNEDFSGKKTRGSQEKQAQRDAADRGVSGDQGGHIFAHRFVKDQGSINLVPQNGDLNNRVWGAMEQEWGNWIASGKRVDVEVNAIPVGQDRPDTFRVIYDVVDPKSGKVVYSNNHVFDNKAGQSFNRVPASVIENSRANVR